MTVWIAPAPALAATHWLVEPKGPLGSLCLDDPNSSTANGTRLIVYGCNNDANQYWYWNASTVFAGGWQIESAYSTPSSNDRCVTTQNAGTSNGTPVIQWVCYNEGNETWKPTPYWKDSSTGLEYYVLSPENAGAYCLTFTGGKAYSGAQLEIDKCTYADNQLWTWISG